MLQGTIQRLMYQTRGKNPLVHKWLTRAQKVNILCALQLLTF